MAIEKCNFCFEGTSTITWNLFTDLEEAFDWESVTGTDDAKVFQISNKLSLKFEGFDSARTSTSSSYVGFIKMIVDGNEQTIYDIAGDKMTAYRKYRITIGDAGDIVLQLGDGNYDLTPQAGTCVIFAVVNVQNTETDDTGYGIYTPRNIGGSGNASVTMMNPTPYYFETDDSESITANSNLYFVSTEPLCNIVALVPICGIASKCASVSAYVIMVGNQNVLQGRVEVEDIPYYAIGGLYLIESSDT
jgi:hypothetical protein